MQHFDAFMIMNLFHSRFIHFKWAILKVIESYHMTYRDYILHGPYRIGLLTLFEVTQKADGSTVIANQMVRTLFSI